MPFMRWSCISHRSSPITQLPLTMGPQGLVPMPPATLRAQLVARVSAIRPDFTANLPGTLIEDIVSTDVAAIVIANQFLVDLVNSVTPYGANAFLLKQLGIDIYGIQPSSPNNTSVDLIFSGTPGFIIIPGFTVTDGVYQYICQNGGVIGTNGNSLPIYALASMAGTWAVPAGTVTGFITSVPLGISLSVINPTDGIPSTTAETETSFRTRTLTAGLAASTGMDRYLKTLLWNIPGVVKRLVSVRQNLDDCSYAILVGGGDPYQVAWAIYYALGDLSSLARPNIEIAFITSYDPTNANPQVPVITTKYNHNLLTGMTETLDQILGMQTLNGQQFVVTVLTDKTFTIPVNLSTLGNYISGGIVIPNPILQEISLNSYPDNYLIPFILPPQQLVTMVVSWNTDSPNYVSAQAISQAASPALTEYINSLYVGTSPINVYEMEAIFLYAVRNVVASENVTVLKFDIMFDNISYAPDPGTGIITGDPFSYFATTTDNVVIQQIGQQA
jgi:Ubiquitin-activating enzyme E1 FCCH domain